jgi:hypothetical protein
LKSSFNRHCSFTNIKLIVYIIGNFKVMIYFLLARFARIKINLFQRFKNG